MEVLCLFFSPKGLERAAKYGIMNTHNACHDENEVICVKKLLIFLAFLLCLTAAAAAEEIPTLPGQFILRDLPGDTYFTVYTGPGEDYLVAADGKAKVSTNDVIRCFGRLEDWWVLVEYGVSGSQRRIGCIDLSSHTETIDKSRVLALADLPLMLQRPCALTDDPNGAAKVLGYIKGEITLLSWKNPDWAYVEGTLKGQRVRGFLPRSALAGASLPPDLPILPDADSYVTLVSEADLGLKKGAQRDLSVYGLTDGTLLLTYRIAGSEELLLRVISREGRKLWAKSVSADRFFEQITVTADGFLLETFDDSEMNSGRRYQFTGKGRKWKSGKVAYIDDPDRAYSDCTASFAVRFYPFREGSIIPMEVECLTSSASAPYQASITYGNHTFLHEMDGMLALHGRDETEEATVRLFDAQAREISRIPADVSWPVRAAAHEGSTLWLFTRSDEGWSRWTCDTAAMALAGPVALPVPDGCSLTALTPNGRGGQYVLLNNDFGAYLCDLTEGGQLWLMESLPGQAVWAAPGEGGFLVLLHTPDGFMLRRYGIA